MTHASCFVCKSVMNELLLTQGRQSWFPFSSSRYSTSLLTKKGANFCQQRNLSERVRVIPCASDISGGYKSKQKRMAGRRRGSVIALAPGPVVSPPPPAPLPVPDEAEAALGVVENPNDARRKSAVVAARLPVRYRGTE